MYAFTSETTTHIRNSGIIIEFGPVFNKFREAIGLLEEGAAFTVNSAIELENVLNNLLSDENLFEECAVAAGKYVYGHKGATHNILNYIQANRLLIS